MTDQVFALKIDEEHYEKIYKVSDFKHDANFNLLNDK